MAGARRDLGYTESNWCLAMEGGTGITVSAFLFGLSISKAAVQAAVNKLLALKPSLNSQIGTGKSKLFIEISQKILVVVEEVANPYAAGGKISAAAGNADVDEATDIWVKIVELEMNTMFPNPKKSPSPVLQVHLYRDLPDTSSTLVVLRMHPCAADMESTSPIGSTFLTCLSEAVDKEKSGESLKELLKQKLTLDGGVVEKFEFHPAMEKAVPKGFANKSLWALGKDVVGYGLLSTKLSYLPFKNTKSPRKSRLIRASLSKEATERLMKVCKENSADLFGAMSAAGLKSAAALKNIGKKGEHYGVVVLYNCRAQLEPKLPEDALGFYESAVLKITVTTENLEYWPVAANCTKDFQGSIKSKKHFTDMGSLNVLMVQAIQHPNLTPSGTMRTAMYATNRDPIVQSTPEKATELLQLKDYVSTMSTQGVGACLSIFSFLREGELHFSFVFCTPLFARREVQTLVDSIVGYLTV